MRWVVGVLRLGPGQASRVRVARGVGVMRACRAAVVGAAVAAVLLASGAAQAAGVGGIEVTPPSGSSFAVRVPENGQFTQPFTVRNVGTSPATVRLYGAAAQEANGTWSIGRAGSASWLHLSDQRVTLQPGEQRAMTFRVDGGAPRTGAVVVEQGQGSVVQRAATLVRTSSGPRLPVPLLLAVAAGVLLLVAGSAVGVVARRRRAAGVRAERERRRVAPS